MFKFIRKALATAKVIQVNYDELVKEVTELTGVVKVVVQEIIYIWK